MRRNGETIGKRISTRMAYLTKAIVIDGNPAAFRGHIMREDMTGWSMHPRRIEVSEILRTFRHQPSVKAIANIKRTLPIAEAPAWLQARPALDQPADYTGLPESRSSELERECESMRRTEENGRD